MVADLGGHIMHGLRDQNENHVIQKCIECIRQKFATNVVKKCLTFGGPVERQFLVSEMCKKYWRLVMIKYLDRVERGNLDFGSLKFHVLDKDDEMPDMVITAVQTSGGWFTFNSDARGRSIKTRCFGIITTGHMLEVWENEESILHLRHWVSPRGQTLFRTVRGMMYYRGALKIQAFLDMADETVEVSEGGILQKVYYSVLIKAVDNRDQILSSFGESGVRHLAHFSCWFQ
ncbi:hypothetical protein C5167_043741 [Papaver somniferum]|uniref:Glycosyl transferase 48 domain-containing protein n=1 Tax=Papaver somniferum TaxID=3469 RepID=A0A4Y7L6M2_PAPSO|nr:hypothetical protein C5167_043741 [Papaver somniferum]